MTPQEEAEEDVLLEAAAAAASPGTVAVTDCSSLVVDKEDTAAEDEQPRPATPVKPRLGSWNALRGKPGSWVCGGCALRVDPESEKCPACLTARDVKTAVTAPGERHCFGNSLPPWTMVHLSCHIEQAHYAALSNNIALFRPLVANDI